MKKNTRRALTLLLALVLCLGLLPTAALAAKTSVTYQPDDNPTLSVNPNAPEFVEDNPPGGTFTVKNERKDDDPVAEDAPSERVFITFESGLGWGKFSNGQSYVTIEAIPVPGQDSTWEVQFPDEDPVSVREGYVFDGWYMSDGKGGQIPLPDYVSKSDTVLAKWAEETGGAGTDTLASIIFDANGGTFDDGVDSQITLINEKPDSKNQFRVPFPSKNPVRTGYTFTGWYTDEAGTHPAPERAASTTTFYAGWKKDAAAQAPFRVDFIPNGGNIVSIRGLPAKDIIAGSTKAQENKVFVDQYSGIGMMETGKDGRLDEFPVIEREGYTLDGWYIFSADLNKAYSGKEVDIPSGAKKVDLSTVFTADARLAAKWTKGSANPNGPFTVKFDLNYKNPPKAEIPKEQKLSKGQTVDLPDGKKLTVPASNLEFYAWCLKGADGKLYPWKDGTPVTVDMTLYAGWIRKGAAVKDGEAVPEASDQPAQQPSAPAAPKFTDVAAASPFAPAISWAVEKKITNGKTATTFAPGEPCTRAQIVTFLYRAMAD